MGLTSYFSSKINKKTVIAEIFGDKTWVYFWEARFLPRWLPLLLGLSLGTIEAFLIVKGLWHLAIPLAAAIPVAILFNRYPFAVVMIWLLFVPYFLNEPTAAGRVIYWLLYRALIPFGLGVVILSDWMGIKKREPVRLGRAELSMLLFLGVLTVNILLLSTKGKTQTFIKAYDLILIPFCLYWLIRLLAPTEKDWKRFLWIAFITIIAQATIGIISWFAPELLPPKWVSLVGERTVGSLRNVAVYTSTLLFCSLLLFQYAVNSASTKLRFGLLVTFGLALYCVFMSFSRASWLGEGVILLSLIFIHPKVVIRFAVVLGIVIYVLSGTLLAEQVAWSYERLTGEEAQDSAESRASVTNASLKMIERKPFFGWGYGNFDQYKQPFMERVGNIRLHDNETSHNTYLTILTELGATGFFFYIFPVVWWLILSLKVRQRLPSRGFWSWQLLVILWLVIVHMFIVSSFMDMIRFFPFGNALWWLVLALIGNMVNAYLKPVDTQAPKWAQLATNSLYR